MRSRDLAMIVVSLLAMVAGSFLPQLAEPLAPFPRFSLMVLLFLGFLSVGTEALFTHARLIPGTVAVLLLARLVALPLFAFMVFSVLMPSFSLGALLLGGASIGVMAPVFSMMVNADTALVLAANLLSSLLLPLTLPMLLSGIKTGMGMFHLEFIHLSADFSLSGMVASLCITIFIPFGAAFLIRRLPDAAEYILKRQFIVALIAVLLSTTAIFSKYADVLHQSPLLVVRALGAACLLGLLMMSAGLFLPGTFPAQRRLAFLVSYGTMNNVLMLIVSIQFFSVTESLMAAMYLVPLNLLLIPYRWLSRRWGVEEH